MKENASGYWCNLCSLNRERDAVLAAKLLVLPTSFLFRQGNLRSRFVDLDFVDLVVDLVVVLHLVPLFSLLKKQVICSQWFGPIKMHGLTLIRLDCSNLIFFNSSVFLHQSLKNLRRV